MDDIKFIILSVTKLGTSRYPECAIKVSSQAEYDEVCDLLRDHGVHIPSPPGYDARFPNMFLDVNNDDVFMNGLRDGIAPTLYTIEDLRNANKHAPVICMDDLI